MRKENLNQGDDFSNITNRQLLQNYVHQVPQKKTTYLSKCGVIFGYPYLQITCFSLLLIYGTGLLNKSMEQVKCFTRGENSSTREIKLISEKGKRTTIRVIKKARREHFLLKNDSAKRF